MTKRRTKHVTPKDRTQAVDRLTKLMNYAIKLIHDGKVDHMLPLLELQLSLLERQIEAPEIFASAIRSLGLKIDETLKPKVPEILRSRSDRELAKVKPLPRKQIRAALEQGRRERDAARIV